MLTTSERERVALDLLRGWNDRATVAVPSRDVHGFEKADALAIAERLRALRVAGGDVPAGYKVGFTNPGVRAQFGADDLLAAPMYEQTVTSDRQVEAAAYLGPRIEPEVVLGLGPEGIAWAAFGFEIVQSHAADWHFGWTDAIADFGLHARLVVGERRPFVPDDAERLAAMSVRLLRNGLEVETGSGADIDGGPVGSLAWLLEDLMRCGRTLVDGEIVSTGSLTRVPQIAAGEVWTVEAEGAELAPLTIHVT